MLVHLYMYYANKDFLEKHSADLHVARDGVVVVPSAQKKGN